MGELIHFKDGKPIVPLNPIIGFIEGDGIGREITPVMRKIVDAAVELAYGDSRKIVWEELYAGEKALEKLGNNLPEQTLKRLQELGVAIKGPMNTPIGKGFRSLNVEIRKRLCLYSCERPVKKYPNVPSPLVNPDNVDMMIFRENTEDVYRGIEWQAGSKEARVLIDTVNDLLMNEGRSDLVSVDAGVGVKTMSKESTERLVKRALDYAISENKPSVTFVHKGNIQKYTEGAFRDWAYEYALKNYGLYVITEDQLWRDYNGKAPAGKIVLKDRIADNMFQQTLLYPERYSVIVAMNLTGDFLSDHIAALSGGLGIAPGANIGDDGAVFEATHGTAPDIAGKNLANPSSLILSAAMMLKYMGWVEAERAIDNGLRATLLDKVVTGDFRSIPGAKVVGTREFGDYLVGKLR